MSTPAQKLLTLEDLSVGQKFHTRTHALDETQIKNFASQFDPQPFHLDDDAAKNTFFQGLAASGWHTASITMRLMVESLPIQGGLIGAGGEISWTKPTRATDILRVEIEIMAIHPSKSRPERGMVTIQTVTFNQKDEVVQKITSRLVVPSRSGVETGVKSSS